VCCELLTLFFCHFRIVIADCKKKKAVGRYTAAQYFFLRCYVDIRLQRYVLEIFTSAESQAAPTLLQQ